MEENNKSLEKALSGLGEKDKGAQKANEDQPQMSKEEEIGFHKGALNTLVAERNELVKMVSNVEAIMQAHLKRLEELGIKIPVQTTENKTK